MSTYLISVQDSVSSTWFMSTYLISVQDLSHQPDLCPLILYLSRICLINLIYVHLSYICPGSVSLTWFMSTYLIFVQDSVSSTWFMSTYLMSVQHTVSSTWFMSTYLISVQDLSHQPDLCPLILYLSRICLIYLIYVHLSYICPGSVSSTWFMSNNLMPV